MFKKGTTAGTLKFTGGLAAFVESRQTTDHGNRQHSYKDGVQKFFIISRQSNLLFLGIGSGSRCRILAGKLATRVKISEFLGRHIAKSGGETIKATVGIEDALQMAQERLDKMAHGNPELGDPPNQHIFGGILIGQGPSKEYIAYYIGLNKARRIDPQRISDRLYFACGSGAQFALQKLRDLNVNPRGTAATVNNIKTTILFTCFNNPQSGGETYVFLLYHGRDLPKKPAPILDPVTVHLENHGFLADRIILLLIDEKKVGQFDEIEQGIKSWAEVYCVSRLAIRGTYWAYRIFCLDAERACSAFEFLTLNRAPPEHRDCDISSSFEHVYAVVGGKYVESYAGMCSRDRLEFITELEFIKGLVDEIA